MEKTEKNGSTKKTVLAVFVLVCIFAIGFFIGRYCENLIWEMALENVIAKRGLDETAEPQTSFTDGVIEAVFDEEAGTLTFSGHGAVDGTSSWLTMTSDQKRVVRRLVFADGITSVSDCEFDGNLSGMPNLAEVVFEGDINAIGDCAFSENSNLKKVEFGGKCGSIGMFTFYRCSSLENIALPDGCAVGQYAFYGTPIDSPAASPAPATAEEPGHALEARGLPFYERSARNSCSFAVVTCCITTICESSPPSLAS